MNKTKKKKKQQNFAIYKKKPFDSNKYAEFIESTGKNLRQDSAYQKDWRELLAKEHSYKKINPQQLCFIDDLLSLHKFNSQATSQEINSRLAADELLSLNLIVQLMKQTISRNNVDIKLDGEKYLTEFYTTIGFELTRSQKQAIEQLTAQYKKQEASVQLLQGDVGSGKTVVALAMTLIHHSCNQQIALVAPTELLAQQLYQKVYTLLEPFGVLSCCLTGSIKAKDKKNNKAKPAKR